jgi:hypothetical protein
VSQTAESAIEFSDLPLDPVDPGTNLLLTGPSMGGTRDLCLQLLDSEADGILAIAADESGPDAVDRFERVARPFDPSRMGVIDCSGRGDEDQGRNVCTVASPADLTGIGIQFSRLFGHLGETGVPRVRTGLYSLSTILPYVDEIQPVFRFLHTLTGRIRTADGLGVCTIDPETQDDRVLGSVSQPFDGRLELRRVDGEAELRLVGLRDHDDDWRPYDLA